MLRYLPLFRGLRLLLGGGGTSDNLDELTGNDGLTGTVVENLELVDHVTSVLGGVVHCVLARGLLAGVALSKCLYMISTLFARPSPANIPSKASWQERTRGGWGGQPRRSRRKRSWLEM